MSDSSDATQKLNLGELNYDTVRNELSGADGGRVHLRAQTAKVLAYLVEHAGDLVERLTHDARTRRGGFGHLLGDLVGRF